LIECDAGRLTSRAPFGLSEKGLHAGMGGACFVNSSGLYFMEDTFGLVRLVLETKSLFPLRWVFINHGQGIGPISPTYFLEYSFEDY
jgi:hypothetical protein